MFFKVAVFRPREDQPKRPVFFPWRGKAVLIGMEGGVPCSFSSERTETVVSFSSSDVKKKKKKSDNKENPQIVQMVSLSPVTNCPTHEHLLECRNELSKRQPSNTYFAEHVWSF